MKNKDFKSYLYILLVSLLTFCLSEIAFAYVGENEDGWDYAYQISEECFNPSDGAPVGQIFANACIAEALKESEAEMNAIYKSLLSVLLDEQMLRGSQRAWLKFKDLECKLRTSGMEEGGTSGTLFFWLGAS